MNKVIVLVGFSAAGKDTLLNDLLEHEFLAAISHTTRPKRNCEKNGREYYFIDKDSFFKMNKQKEFAGSPREYNALDKGIPVKWYYGITKAELDTEDNKVVIIDKKGALALKKELGDRQITVFLDVRESVRRKRCINRGDFKLDEWNRREKFDRVLFNKYSKLKFDLIISKNTRQDCLQELINYLCTQY